MTFELKALRAAADKIGDECFNRQWKSACVNWGDFCCVTAEHYVTEEGDEGYRVYFEEADPSNSEIGAYIRGRLADEGFPDVEVIFEW